MNTLQILLGQIPEAIYFSLFMIFTKRLKNKNILFIILMTIEYVLLFQAFPYSIWGHILFFIISYLILKLLYKDKCQIIDVFTLGIASLLLMIISSITYFIFAPNNVMFGVIISKFILFYVLFLIKDKLYNIQNLYKLLWNRNNKKKKIKSTTFRALNIVIFNTMFYLINLGMLYTIFLKF